MKLKVPLAVATCLLIAMPTVGGSAPDHPVVEGHTTYAEIILDDGEVATLDLIGDIRCHVEVLGVRIAVPPSVDRVGLDCGGDLVVYVTPQGAPDPTAASLTPTGIITRTTGPQGATWTATEFTYVGPDGADHTVWTVPLDGPHVDPDTGATYSFVVPVPSDAVTTSEGLRTHLGSAP